MRHTQPASSAAPRPGSLSRWTSSISTSAIWWLTVAWCGGVGVRCQGMRACGLAGEGSADGQTRPAWIECTTTKSAGSRRRGSPRRPPPWRGATCGLFCRCFERECECIGFFCAVRAEGTNCVAAFASRPSISPSKIRAATTQHRRPPSIQHPAASSQNGAAPNFSGVVHTRSAPSSAANSASLSPDSSTACSPSGPKRAAQSAWRSWTSALRARVGKSENGGEGFSRGAVWCGVGRGVASSDAPPCRRMHRQPSTRWHLPAPPINMRRPGQPSKNPTHTHTRARAHTGSARGRRP